MEHGLTFGACFSEDQMKDGNFSGYSSIPASSIINTTETTRLPKVKMYIINEPDEYEQVAQINARSVSLGDTIELRIESDSSGAQTGRSVERVFSMYEFCTRSVSVNYLVQVMSTYTRITWSPRLNWAIVRFCCWTEGDVPRDRWIFRHWVGLKPMDQSDWRLDSKRSGSRTLTWSNSVSWCSIVPVRVRR